MAKDSKKIEALDILKRFMKDAYAQGWNGVHSVYSCTLDEKGKAIKGLSLNAALKEAGYLAESYTSPASEEVKNEDGTLKYAARVAGQWVKDGLITSRFTNGGIYIKATEKLGVPMPLVVEGKAEVKVKSNKTTKLFGKVFTK